MNTSMVGRRIGRYEIIGEIGRGGMGIVYRATQTSLNRTVAVKMLPLAFAQSPELLARFRREAETLARLSHENVVHVYDVEELDGNSFIVMEYVAGPSLGRLLRDHGALPAAVGRDVGAAVAAGLGAAHNAGIVHRDIKPDNVLFTPSGRPKLTDFGIARMEDARIETQTGSLLGTPHYVAPEQARGERAGERSDIYSLGVALYEIVAGQRPFRGSNPIELYLKHIQEDPPPLRDAVPDLPPALAALIHACLEKDPDRRPANGSVLAQELEALDLGAVPGRALRSWFPTVWHAAADGHGGEVSPLPWTPNASPRPSAPGDARRDDPARGREASPTGPTTWVTPRTTPEADATSAANEGAEATTIWIPERSGAAGHLAPPPPAPGRATPALRRATAAHGPPAGGRSRPARRALAGAAVLCLVFASVYWIRSDRGGESAETVVPPAPPPGSPGALQPDVGNEPFGAAETPGSRDGEPSRAVAPSQSEAGRAGADGGVATGSDGATALPPADSKTGGEAAAAREAERDVAHPSRPFVPADRDRESARPSPDPNVAARDGGPVTEPPRPPAERLPERGRTLSAQEERLARSRIFGLLAAFSRAVAASGPQAAAETFVAPGHAVSIGREMARVLGRYQSLQAAASDVQIDMLPGPRARVRFRQVLDVTDGGGRRERVLRHDWIVVPSSGDWRIAEGTVVAQ